MTPPRWFTDTDEGHSQWYIQRFRDMAAQGVDLAGEARLIDAMVPPHSRILDAGCGPGRTGAELHARGHDVIGVDADAELIEAAREDHPGPRWYVADLATLDLPALGEPEPFDAAILAGNVMAFVAPDTETAVLRHVRAHLKPDAFAVIGFHTDRYDMARLRPAPGRRGLHARAPVRHVGPAAMAHRRRLRRQRAPHTCRNRRRRER